MSTNPAVAISDERAEQENLEDPEISAIDAYEISASPNDFNIATIYSFILSGVVKIPGFQRHYVWDLKRASKLMESLLIGLPIPQIFLYEESRNLFLVIDGQQRLMSIYYFRKGRFPREDKRTALRQIFDLEGGIPDTVFADPEYFINFNLKLPNRPDGTRNPFNGFDYSSLGDHTTSFDLKTIRNVIIKQLVPKDDNSAVYEIFNRLNTGGVNLKPQEIRASLYHSKFFDMLGRLNELPSWRRLLGEPTPDEHMQDIQSLLRGFALLLQTPPYSSSMVRFLDRSAQSARLLPLEKITYLDALFSSFLNACASLKDGLFSSITLFESVFIAACAPAFAQSLLVTGRVTPASIEALQANPAFVAAASRGTTTAANVNARLSLARQIIQLT